MIRPTRGTAAAACLCAAAAAVVVALTGMCLADDVPPDVALPATVTSHPATTTPASTGPDAAGAPGGTWLPDGATLVADEHGLLAAVDEVRLVGDDLQVPDDPRRVGWWSGSAVPGSAEGTVVVDGHVNYDGVTGALAVLPRMSPGDDVELRSGTTVVRYTVQAVQTYAKDDGLPADLFTPGGPPRLALITCGGRYDQEQRSYEDNVVVMAVPG